MTVSIQRKSFHWTGGFRELEKEGLFGRKKIVRVHQDFDEVLQQVQEFIESIGRERFVNVCEYTQCRDRIGDDKTTTIVVWYWK